MNNEEMGFQVELSDQEVRTLLYAVQEALRVWPGSPARPREEQEQLQALKHALFTMTLEAVWGKEA